MAHITANRGAATIPLAEGLQTANERMTVHPHCLRIHTVATPTETTVCNDRRQGDHVPPRRLARSSGAELAPRARYNCATKSEAITQLARGHKKNKTDTSQPVYRHAQPCWPSMWLTGYNTQAPKTSEHTDTDEGAEAIRRNGHTVKYQSYTSEYTQGMCVEARKNTPCDPASHHLSPGASPSQHTSPCTHPVGQPSANASGAAKGAGGWWAEPASLLKLTTQGAHPDARNRTPFCIGAGSLTNEHRTSPQAPSWWPIRPEWPVHNPMDRTTCRSPAQARWRRNGARRLHPNMRRPSFRRLTLPTRALGNGDGELARSARTRIPKRQRRYNNDRQANKPGTTSARFGPVRMPRCLERSCPREPEVGQAFLQLPMAAMTKAQGGEIQETNNSCSLWLAIARTGPIEMKLRFDCEGINISPPPQSVGNYMPQPPGTTPMARPSKS